MNVARAIILRDTRKPGSWRAYTWAEIGKILAKEEKRGTAYQGASVAKAVSRQKGTASG